jgi:Flp pilus assembly pilin Flp
MRYPTLGRLLSDESGQDLIEYALLTVFVGLAGVALWVIIEGRINAAYTSYDSGVQGLWESPDPGGGS